MTPQLKLQQALIDISKTAEKVYGPDWKMLFDQFKKALDRNDLKGITKAGTELAAGVVRVGEEKT